jgi:Isochorismatase family
VQTTVDALSMTGTKVCLVADACASQPIGALSAEEAHDAAVQRMGYLFAMVTTTTAIIEALRAPAAAR